MPDQSFFQTEGMIDTLVVRGYRLAAAAKSAAWDWRPGIQGGHTAISAVFLCLKHGMPVMSGPCVGAFGHTGSLYRYANPHGSAHHIGVGEWKGNLTRTFTMNASSLKRYRAVSIRTRSTFTVIANSFACARALLPADAAITCRTPALSLAAAQEVFS
ncbi:hypothetical protein [Marinobacterium weihaiense]|uniref:Uncharacterized protein n=1 Tax=Marinobacterium weihaiense TaxID=2851016 RepID=A0ABS6M864_9GAMM|nr:hypothetical protein [Marinobacterium weihaiense]MBV0932370.1 hypothetical protein [Marinobacterium weihaiense]